MKSHNRLIDHITLKVRNLNKSREFYRALAETLGFSISREEADRFFVEGLQIIQNSDPSHSVHLAFKAMNPASVRQFHDEAIKLGSSSLSAPAATFADQAHFSARVRDPDGNNIEVVYEHQKNF
jgi:catechol 2,3-dioxygenase-like lactoylglutathione lyase family enzyme